MPSESKVLSLFRCHVDLLRGFGLNTVNAILFVDDVGTVVSVFTESESGSHLADCNLEIIDIRFRHNRRMGRASIT